MIDNGNDATSLLLVHHQTFSQLLLMAQQEEGWPLGLRPLNARVGLVRNRDLSGSASFTTTLLTASPTNSSSIDSSSDLDTESTGSFFHDKSITLGSLIGVSNILELSRRPARRTDNTGRENKNYKFKPWLFSLCSKLNTDAAMNTNNNDNKNTPSLGHFLEAERRRNQNPANDYSPVLPGSNNPSSASVGEDDEGERKSNREEVLEHGNGYGGVPLLFSCVCGHGQLI